MDWFIKIHNYILETIEKESVIIYFGVGTKYHPTKNSDNSIDEHAVWGFKNNQQFPPFLQDAKQKYPFVKILLILIDPAFTYGTEPYVVKNSENFLEGSWDVCSEYGLEPNHYVSSFGIEVILINKYVKWTSYSTSMLDSNECDIELFLTILAKKISKKAFNNSLLFYHEFTGQNPTVLEDKIKKAIGKDFDGNKICIDISRGADLSCYFNLTDPTNYPIISMKNGSLVYLNPELLDENEKINILNKFIKYTRGFFTDSMSSNSNSNSIPSVTSDPENFQNNFQIFHKNDTNYLLDKPDEMLLCFQIVKSDIVTIKLVSEGIISMIRQFYTITKREFLGTKMYGVPYINKICSRFSFIDTIPVISNLELLDKINASELEQIDYSNSFDSVKMIVLEELYQIVFLVYIGVFTKYNIEIEQIEHFISELKKLPNKYDLMKSNENFVNKIIS